MATGAVTSATVVIPVLNGGRLLGEVVDAVLAQQTPVPFELLAIDSGSTDGSLEVLHERGVRPLRIPNSEFGHGRTRNLAVERSDGDVVAFLTQDATPVSPGWLAAFVTAFDDERVAAAWGPQRARRDADPRTARILAEVYDDRPRLVLGVDEEFPVFSDVNSCLRRKDWHSVRFRDVPYAEDLHLSQDLLAAGRALAYVPAAEVLHSNEVRLRDHLGRMLDEMGALPPWETPVRLPFAVRDWGRQVRKDAAFAWRRSKARTPRDVAWAAVAEAQRSVALYLRNSRPGAFERLARSRSLEAQRRAAASR